MVLLVRFCQIRLLRLRHQRVECRNLAAPLALRTWVRGNIGLPGHTIGSYNTPFRCIDCSTAVYLADLLANELEIHPGDLQGEELRSIDRKNLEILGVLPQYPSFRARALEALH
jgi:hypothetical protein